MTTGLEIRTYELELQFSVLKLYNDEKCIVMSGFTNLVAMDLDSEEMIYQGDYLLGQYGTCMDLIAGGTKVVHSGKDKISVFDAVGRDVVRIGMLFSRIYFSNCMLQLADFF